ncbi:MAG: hypothetical protein ACM37W_01715 [Actinomycetota bacterium]
MSRLGTFRIDDELWERFQALCEAENTSASAELLRFVEWRLAGGSLRQQASSQDLGSGFVRLLESHVENLLAAKLAREALERQQLAERLAAIEAQVATPQSQRLMEPLAEFLDQALEGRVEHYRKVTLGRELERRIEQQLAEHLQGIYQQLTELKELLQKPEQPEQPHQRSLWEENAAAKEQLAQMEVLQQKLELLKEWVLPGNLGQESANSAAQSGSSSPPGPPPVEAKIPSEIKMPDGSSWRADAAGHYEIIGENRSPVTRETAEEAVAEVGEKVHPLQSDRQGFVTGAQVKSGDLLKTKILRVAQTQRAKKGQQMDGSDGSVWQCEGEDLSQRGRPKMFRRIR